MAKGNITIRMDRELKEQAAALFNALGMDLSTATGIFFRQALRCNGLPFDVRIDEPNEETKAAIEEVQRLKADPNKKTYSSFAEILKELDV